MSPSREGLVGRWVHSHEEDTDAGRVFRPADRSFPPSRGREALELRADGTFVGRMPGPTDEPSESTGSWAVEGQELLIRGEGPEPAERAITVLEAEPDRLVLRR